MARRIESSDDRHVMARHSEIYPKEEELQAIQRIVSHTERALKIVSDLMTETNKPKEDNNGNNGTATTTPATQATTKNEQAKTDDCKNANADQTQKEDGRDNQL